MRTEEYQGKKEEEIIEEQVKKKITEELKTKMEELTEENRRT